jgi:hypothetical protein
MGAACFGYLPASMFFVAPVIFLGLSERLLCRLNGGFVPFLAAEHTPKPSHLLRRKIHPLWRW